MVRTIRKLENYHIILWLIKDLCWVMVSKSMGVFMIVPTIGLAIYITVLNRADKSELAHNLAVCFWICANSVWMIGEFYFDEHVSRIAVGFFLAGLLTLASHYAVLFYKKFKLKT